MRGMKKKFFEGLSQAKKKKLKKHQKRNCSWPALSTKSFPLSLQTSALAYHMLTRIPCKYDQEICTGTCTDSAN